MAIPQTPCRLGRSGRSQLSADNIECSGEAPHVRARTSDLADTEGEAKAASGAGSTRRGDSKAGRRSRHAERPSGLLCRATPRMGNRSSLHRS